MKKLLFLLAALAFAGSLPAAGVANAENSGAGLDFGSLSADTAFKDLPGVKPPQEQEAQRDFTCTSEFADDNRIFPGPDRMSSNLVYSCTDGVVTLESKTPPRSLEREKRGLNW